jgi:hypothetical protein
MAKRVLYFMPSGLLIAMLPIYMAGLKISVPTRFLMGTMIITREFAEAGKLVLGTEGGGRSYSGPGGLRLVSDSYNLIKQVGQGEFDTSFRKAAINVIGGFAGLPSAQINRTWNGIEALVEGKTENIAAPVLGFKGR